MSELAPCIVLPLDKVLAWGGFDDDVTAAPRGDAPPAIAALLGLMTTCAWSVDVENDTGDAWTFTARDDFALERADAGQDRVALQLLDRGGLIDRIASRVPAPAATTHDEAFPVDPAIIMAVLESGEDQPRFEERELVRRIAKVPARFTELLMSIRGITRLTRLSPARSVVAVSITILDCGDAGLWLSQTVITDDLGAPPERGADLLRPMTADVLARALAVLADDLADPAADESLDGLLAELDATEAGEPV